MHKDEPEKSVRFRHAWVELNRASCLYRCFLKTDHIAQELGIYDITLVHQKLETGSIAYALDLAGWVLRICRW